MVPREGSADCLAGGECTGRGRAAGTATSSSADRNALKSRGLPGGKGRRPVAATDDHHGSTRSTASCPVHAPPRGRSPPHSAGKSTSPGHCQAVQTKAEPAVSSGEHPRGQPSTPARGSDPGVKTGPPFGRRVPLGTSQTTGLTPSCLAGAPVMFWFPFFSFQSVPPAPGDGPRPGPQARDPLADSAAAPATARRPLRAHPTS